MTAKIDVIIPNLNYGKYLRVCLESIRLQNVKKNVYVVDGGSTDETFEVLKDFPEVKINIVKGNLREAINFGIAHSYSDYISCFASDNVMLLGSLELAQKTLDVNEDVGLVYGRAIEIDSNGEPIGLSWHGGAFSKERLYHHNFIDWSEAVFRRKAWEDFEFPEWLLYHLDWFVWLKISEKWQIVNLGWPVIYYRIHSGSHSKLKQEEITREYMQLKARLKEGIL